MVCCVKNRRSCVGCYSNRQRELSNVYNTSGRVVLNIVRPKTRYYCALITSAAKITRHLADTVNYPLRFNQSQTRIKFEYIIKCNVK